MTVHEEYIDMEWVKKEMYDLKFSVSGKFQAVIHPEYVDSFIAILTTAWNCNCTYANTIAKEFDISLKDFVAIEGDVNLFIKLQLDEMFNG